LKAAMINLIYILYICITIVYSSKSSLRDNIKDRKLELIENNDVDIDIHDKCTSIGLGNKATVDGSTITTHNNDCQDCDIRITHVPARDWPIGSKRPIYGNYYISYQFNLSNLYYLLFIYIIGIKSSYPRYVETKEENIHGEDYLSFDSTIFNWTISKPILYIPQVSHTYGYTLGSYGIQNEKQLSICESTCNAVFAANKLGPPGVGASMHMETLTELALERCTTAREAIQTMGGLATEYGFCGEGFDGELIQAQEESGEALVIADPNETWVFHILSDDTGTGCIWVAKRVPDDHITVVANQFVIGISIYQFYYLIYSH
jgi:dipeptidase